MAFVVFAIIGAFFLIAEHRAHVLPLLPWLFLAACPLMHMFMHGGHGGHRGHGGGNRLGVVSGSFGFLLQWPTLVTLVMFPILVTMYALLAKREERESETELGDEYRRYAARTSAFFPRWGSATLASR